MFAGKKSAQIREILISESAWEEMTCLFAPSLGGAHNGYRNNQTLQAQQTRGNVVGFFDWLLKGNSNFTNIRRSFKVQVNQYNNRLSDNLYLIAGDSFLESLTLALSYAVINPANRNAWPEFMTALRRLCTLEFDSQQYDNLVVFI
ncbi:TPA: hypothetical protein NBQ95_004672, partial [Enterobacter kobei]|nr:hypothetical protein [Enterobacter kobei]